MQLVIYLLLPTVFCKVDQPQLVQVDGDKAFSMLAEKHRSVCCQSNDCLSSPKESGAIWPTGTNTTYSSTTSGSFLPVDYISQSCCGSCSRGTNCILYGTCCLDVYENFNHALESTKNARYECVLSQYLPNEESDFHGDGRRYWMISKCDPAYLNGKYRYLCEHHGFDGSPESVVPVTDSRSYIHYRNIYCYYCNRFEEESSLIYWPLEIKSNESISIPNQNLLTEVKRQRANIFFLQPNFIAVKLCDVPPFKIATCNETGLWKLYNEYIETACHAFLDPFNQTYKNYFCYLCNSAESLSERNWRCNLNQTQGSLNFKPPFLAILDLAAVKGELQSDKLYCSPNQFKDEIRMICRNVLCHADRKLDNGACLQGFKRATNSTCFSAFVRLTPLSSSRHIEASPFMNSQIQHVFMTNLSICNGTELELPVFSYANDLHRVQYFVVFIAVFIPAAHTDCFHFVDTLIALTSDNMNLTDTLGRPISFSLEPAVFNITFTRTYVEISVPHLSDSTVTTLRRGPTEVLENLCDYTKLTEINKLFVCPFVILDVDDFSILVKNGFLFLANLDFPNKTLKTFSKWEYEIHDNELLICLDDFIELYNVMVDSKSRTSQYFPGNMKHTLALICVSVSIVSLLLTVVIYIAHPSLHSQPGINNIIVCTFLLMAQTVYQFGAGQTSLPHYACSLVGAICHFLWLSVMFSMNICCIQMFIIFKRLIQVTPKFDKWRTVKQVLYVVCASLLFVCVNLVISILRSDGVSTGYGGKICYLSSHLMHFITFLVPSAVTLCVNIILFTYVVCKIKKVNSANLLHRERNYFSVYVRLSTLTGLTWLFGFFQLVFQTDVLEYLFIVFNAGQGVFIMVAFVVNKRVLSLVCGKDLFTSQVNKSGTLSK